MRRDDIVGCMLKYPAVKIQEEFFQTGDWESSVSTWVSTGYSVEVSSGLKSGVN